MSDEYLDYGDLIDEAMHYVVRKALERVRKNGLPGDHHFFITFETHHPGVMISDELTKRYPEEMTIVIQHQYWDLEIEENRFSIVLSFDNIKQNLTIPFDALISFADPSVKFGLQFSHSPSDRRAEKKVQQGNVQKAKTASAEPVSEGPKVVSLDSFRKKK